MPLGKTAYVQRYTLHVESGKPAQVFAMKRNNILETVAPYSAMLVIAELEGVVGQYDQTLKQPFKIEELSDIGFNGYVAQQTADISVGVEITLVDN